MPNRSGFPRYPVDPALADLHFNLTATLLSTEIAISVKLAEHICSVGFNGGLSRGLPLEDWRQALAGTGRRSQALSVTLGRRCQALLGTSRHCQALSGVVRHQQASVASQNSLSLN